MSPTCIITAVIVLVDIVVATVVVAIVLSVSITDKSDLFDDGTQYTVNMATEAI